jgi:hypothetical protein
VKLNILSDFIIFSIYIYIILDSLSILLENENNINGT